MISKTGYETTATITSIETPDHLKPYKGKLSDEQFASLLKVNSLVFVSLKRCIIWAPWFYLGIDISQQRYQFLNWNTVQVIYILHSLKKVFLHIKAACLSLLNYMYINLTAPWIFVKILLLELSINSSISLQRNKSFNIFRSHHKACGMYMFA